MRDCSLRADNSRPCEYIFGVDQENKWRRVGNRGIWAYHFGNNSVRIAFYHIGMVDKKILGSSSLVGQHWRFFWFRYCSSHNSLPRIGKLPIQLKCMRLQWWWWGGGRKHDSILQVGVQPYTDLGGFHNSVDISDDIWFCGSTDNKKDRFIGKSCGGCVKNGDYLGGSCGYNCHFGKLE